MENFIDNHQIITAIIILAIFGVACSWYKLSEFDEN
jgi:hypothetical protein